MAGRDRLLLLLVAASLFGRAVCTASSGCSAGEANSSCTALSSGSVLLQRSRLHAPEALVLAGMEEEKEEEEGGDFCCYSANDANDACGTCNSVADASTFCAQSEGNCKQCAGAKATWCSAGISARQPMLAPAPQSASTFCCWSARDAGDFCGSCQSRAPVGNWCARSKDQCNSCAGGKAVWCDGDVGSPSQTPLPTPLPTQVPAPTLRPSPLPTASPTGAPTTKPPPAAAPPAPRPQPARPSSWDGTNMKMTHYWDCSGQGCDAATLQPWNEDKYISPPTYGPQDPADFGGPVYGEVMWLTGAASDALSELMGADDGCCGGDPNDGGVGGCGKCALVQNPDSLHPEWTAVVMKKNRCPPWSNGCGAGEPHFDVAAPGFDNLQWSTANVCGIRPGTGFQSQQQSAVAGSWWSECANTADCARLCDGLPSEYQRGCKLFASWGWKQGDPSSVKFKAVECPAEFVKHVGAQFGASGPTPTTQALVVTDSEEEGEGSAQRRKPGAPEPPSAFCCFWASDASDACGSCTSKSPRGSWCAQSKDRCNSCSEGKAVWCDGVATPPMPMPLPPTPAPTEAPMPTPPPTQPTASPMPAAATPAPTPAPTLAPSNPSMPSQWDGSNMKMTHYWDCSGQGCDAATLQPWSEDKYISPPGYGPQDPADFGGPAYGEVMWVTGAASDALSALMGDDDGCCGADPNDGGVGGCGKCALVQNPDSLHPEWTAVVMKKNRCPPWSNGCGAGEPHFDVAAPGFDNLQWSTANVCGIRQGTGFQSQQQSAAAGSWWSECANTADCAHLCDKLPSEYQRGCKLFASWGWKKGNPSSVKFKAVDCPKEFVKHVGAQFGASGPTKA